MESTGLGGEVLYGKKGMVYANIIDAETGKIEITKYNTKTMKDSNGNKFKIVNGQIQVDVVEMAENAGVGDTVSWWKDKKSTNIVVQPDMKYAPVQVTRAGNDVNIKAYIGFSGDANQLMPSTVTSYITSPNSASPQSGFTYAEIAAQGIANNWSGAFAIGGQNINLKTTIYSNNYSPNHILNNVIASDKQEFLNINVDSEIGRSNQNDGNVISYIQDFLFGGRTKSGEVVYDNWSVDNPGKIKLYASTEYSNVCYNPNDPSSYLTYSAERFGGLASHEFGHALGLGDAYGEKGYRNSAPVNNYINNDHITIPENDLMRGSKGNVTSADVYYMLNAW